MNLSFPVTNHIGNIFRFADFDSAIVVLLKEGELQRRPFLPCELIVNRDLFISCHTSSHAKPARPKKGVDGALCADLVDVSQALCCRRQSWTGELQRAVSA